MAADSVRIKRYPNRRFYDTNASKYVSLREIEEMVGHGATVEIVDSQSGEEITRAVLTQIILDRQPDKISLFPVDMLHCIVRSNDMVTGFLRDYFQHSLTYLDYLQKHDKSPRELANPMHWVTAWLDSMKPTGGASGPAADAGAPPPEEQDPLQQKIEQLEERIRQLETKEA